MMLCVFILTPLQLIQYHGRLTYLYHNRYLWSLQSAEAALITVVLVRALSRARAALQQICFEFKILAKSMAHRSSQTD